MTERDDTRGDVEAQPDDVDSPVRDGGPVPGTEAPSIPPTEVAVDPATGEEVSGSNLVEDPRTAVEPTPSAADVEDDSVPVEGGATSYDEGSEVRSDSAPAEGAPPVQNVAPAEPEGPEVAPTDERLAISPHGAAPEPGVVSAWRHAEVESPSPHDQALVSVTTPEGRGGDAPLGVQPEVEVDEEVTATTARYGHVGDTQFIVREDGIVGAIGDNDRGRHLAEQESTAGYAERYLSDDEQDTVYQAERNAAEWADAEDREVEARLALMEQAHRDRTQVVV